MIWHLNFVCAQTSVFMTHSVHCNFPLHRYASIFHLWAIAEKSFLIPFSISCATLNLQPSKKTKLFFRSTLNYSSEPSSVSVRCDCNTNSYGVISFPWWLSAGFLMELQQIMTTVHLQKYSGCTIFVTI